MIRAIADTHAVIWYIYDDSRLSTTAKTAMQDAATKGDQIGISAISLAETVYLVEKGRVAPATLDRLLAALDQPDSVLIEIAVDRLVVWAMRSVDRASILLIALSRPRQCDSASRSLVEMARFRHLE